MGRPPSSPANPLLAVLKETLTALVRSDTRDYSARQLTVLLKVYLEPDGTQTVRGLAGALNVSKPAVTRAIDRLQADGNAKRELDPADRRSIFVKRTAAGSAYVRTLSGYLAAASKKAG
jgi:DNA-binding MarR family transcriptional regulator